ncbi:thioredoxin domain-containing protein [Candidatus Saccharibacteria bacterium]|nr:thioredoxin domain-containing protein [Candidatus Saccharibacteria bacterium]
MSRALRIGTLVGIFILIFAALIFSSVKPPDVTGELWNENMTLGDPSTATRHYIVYTDLMCPYCNYYAKLVQENESDLLVYLTEHKIAYEVRVTDMLYEGSGVELSRPAAEGAYCAAREGKFWEFYHAAVSELFSVYYDKGIGNSKTAPMITDMTRDFWYDLGKSVGVGETFKTCYKNSESVAEIEKNTEKASASALGLPSFAFNKFTTSGFDPTWDWSVVKQMYDAGL